MKRTALVAGAAALSLAACSGAVGSETSVVAPAAPETTRTLADPGTTVGAGGDVEELLADLQGRFVDFGAQIEASGAEAELNEAWSEAQAVMLEAMTTIQSGEVIDMATIEPALDDFEQAVPATEAEVLDAWQELRATLEQAIQTSNAG